MSDGSRQKKIRRLQSRAINEGIVADVNHLGSGHFRQAHKSVWRESPIGDLRGRRKQNELYDTRLAGVVRTGLIVNIEDGAVPRVKNAPVVDNVVCEMSRTTVLLAVPSCPWQANFIAKSNSSHVPL
jgi:hypothetical protein